MKLLASLAVVSWSMLATVAGATTLPAGFTEQLVVSGINAPTAMAFAPDGRLFVCEQGGAVRVITTAGVLLPTPFVALTVNSTGERGLLGIAFDPAFSTNQYVYVYYTATTPSLRNRVSRFIANGNVVGGSEQVLLDIIDVPDPDTASNHNGGAIHFDATGKLLIAIGERANPPNSQTGTSPGAATNLLGKILRMNPDGTIPTDNPFYGTATGLNRLIWAYGLRNPFTFDVQPGTGRVFINDVGEVSWEEINDGIAGRNYGWPQTEGALSPAQQSQYPGVSGPLYTYGHTGGACAIVGGAFYNPSVVLFPTAYVGRYFFADTCANWIRVLDPANGNAVSDFATNATASIVDLKTGPEGALYYLARVGGAVRRIVPGVTTPTATVTPTRTPTPAGTPTVTPTGTPVPQGFPGGRGNEFVVNTYTTNSQNRPAIGSDAGGNFVVVWDSYAQDGSQHGVFGQRFDASGNRLGNELAINTYTPGIQLAPAVAVGSNGAFVVTWTGYYQDGSGNGVFGQQFGAAGERIGGEFQVNSYTTGPQNFPTVGMDATSNFVVVWNQYGGHTLRELGQRFSSAGTRLGSEFQISMSTSELDWSWPKVAVASSGRFVVGWTRGFYGQGEVFARMFDASGAAIGAEFAVNSYTTGDQRRPSIAIDDSGQFVVVWASDGQDGDRIGVFGQRFDSGGSRVGSEFQVNSFTSGNQRYATASMDGTGNFVVMWTSTGEDGSGDGVFGQRYDADGSRIGVEFQANTLTLFSQRRQDVSLDRNGQFVVVWRGYDANNYGVLGQRFEFGALTPTAAPTGRPTVTATATDTPRPTFTPSPTATNTPTPTFTTTPSPTATETPIPTATNTATPTATSTPTPTPTATETPSPTATASPTFTPTSTPTPTATVTQTPVPAPRVSHQQTVTGTLKRPRKVVSGTVAAVPDQLYLASVVVRGGGTVGSMSGLGGTWTKQASQCSARGTVRVELWSGVVSGTGQAGPVTANLHGVAHSATIAVSRYSGARQRPVFLWPVSFNTNGDAGACNGGNLSNFVFGYVPGVDVGTVHYVAVAFEGADHSSSENFVERAEAHDGVWALRSGIAVEDRTSVTESSTALFDTLSSDQDWAVIVAAITE